MLDRPISSNPFLALFVYRDSREYIILFCLFFSSRYLRLRFYRTIPEMIHRMSRVASKSTHIPPRGPRRNMNCNFANLAEAIVEFSLVVASRPEIFSMLTMSFRESSHLT